MPVFRPATGLCRDAVTSQGAIRSEPCSFRGSGGASPSSGWIFVFIGMFLRGQACIPDAAGRRLAAIEGIAELEVFDAVRDLAVQLLAEGSVPRHAEVDAFHISVAAVHGMAYLLTWNCKHIANAAMRPKVEGVCRHYGYEPPVICTPQELMEE